MADLNFPAGVGTQANSFVGFRGYFGTIQIPGGPHQTNNGEFPILITAVETYVGGGANTLLDNQNFRNYVSRNITLQIDDASTAQFTVAGGPPVATGFRGISKSYGNGTTATFRVVNAGTDQYLRYGWRAVTGYQLFSLRFNATTGAPEAQGTLQSGNPAGPTGTLRYVFAPLNPRNLRFDSNESTSVNLAWDYPASDGESGVTKYRLEMSSNGFATVSLNELNGSFSSLNPQTTYQFRVAAHNAVTDARGTWSIYSNVVTKQAVPTTPSLTVSRTGLIYTINGSSTINSGSVSSYRFSSRSSTNGGTTFTDWSAETTLNGSTYSTTFASSAATTYQFRVRAIAASGAGGSYNSSGNFHTPNVPLIPSNAIVLTKNVKKVNVDWDSFRTNANTNSVYNGAVIAGHQIQFRYSGDKGSTWTNFEALTPVGITNASTTFILTENLLVAKTYEFRVLATSDVGNSAYQTSPQIFISAYGSRASGPTTFLPIENAKIFLGVGQPGTDASGWRTIENIRKFDGTWKDLET
jgi:hypothetical protein